MLATKTPIFLMPFLCILICVVFASAGELLPTDRPVAEVIDHYIHVKLEEAGVLPAEQATDTVTLRRLSLDLAGRIPVLQEAKNYLRSTDPAKRQHLVDRLMDSPDYVHHSATEFDTLLKGYDPSAPSLQKYLLAAMGENRPWDQMFRELLGAEPDVADTPYHFVLKRLRDRDVLTRDVSSVFFGINISCCQCHDHPFVDNLTQDYFYGIKAFFNGAHDFHGHLLQRQYTSPLGFKTKAGEDRQARLMFLTGGIVEQPALDVTDLNASIEEENKLIEKLKKEFEEKRTLPQQPEFRPLKQLANIALAPDQRRLLAQSIVNRLWHRFLGYGLVMRVDQMHDKNQSSHPQLLQWLTRDFIDHGYDLRRLTRGIVNSRTYSRTSRWKNDSPPDPSLFAVANIRPLTPMQYGLSLCVATNPEAIRIDQPPAIREERLAKLEEEAHKLYAPLIEQPHEDLQINVNEALKFSNDEDIYNTLGSGLILQLIQQEQPHFWIEKIENAVWTVLSRPPSDDEIEILRQYLARRNTNDVEKLKQLAETRSSVRKAKSAVGELEKQASQIVDQQRTQTIGNALARTSDYLSATAQLFSKSENLTLETLADQGGLDADILLGWSNLARPFLPNELLVELLAAKMNAINSNQDLRGWGSDACPWFGANATNKTVSAGFQVPARSLAMHPGASQSVGLGWRSPVEGRIRIAIQVSDGHPEGGNGIAWSVEQKHDQELQSVANGTVGNGKSFPAEGDTNEFFTTVSSNDMISVVISANEGNYSCDTTILEFVVSELEGKKQTWDATAQLVDRIHENNPCSDSYGNENVWYFHIGSDDGQPLEKKQNLSLLAQWVNSLSDPALFENRNALATELQTLLLSDTVPADNNTPLYADLKSPTGSLFKNLDFATRLQGDDKLRFEKLRQQIDEWSLLTKQPEPSASELTSSSTYAALHQLVWALLMSPEFRFNY